MTIIDVLMCPGTGYPNGGDGVCETFMGALDLDRFAPRIVPFPATYGGPKMAYATSRAAGRRALLDAIRASDNQCIIGGFSAGAAVAGDVAAEVGRGDHPELEVVAAALLADPARPLGDGMPGRAVAPWFGISGPRPIFGVPVWWAAALGDPITSLGPGSPLRSIADLTEFYSLADPVAAFEWGRDLVDRAQRGRWQHWWNPANWSTWAGAVRDAVAYTPIGGRHGRAYVLEGYCHELAACVNAAVPA